MKRFIYWLLTMLGFSSIAGCEPALMYGTPSADYEIKGKVLDADGDPIKGIKVNVQNDWHSAFTSQGTECQSLDNGDYSVRIKTFPTDKLHLIVQDIDGAENGGEFEEKTVELDFSKIEYTGDKDAWYSGKKSLEQNIVLEEKVSKEE